MVERGTEKTMKDAIHIRDLLFDYHTYTLVGPKLNPNHHDNPPKDIMVIGNTKNINFNLIETKPGCDVYAHCNYTLALYSTKDGMDRAWRELLA